jgi:hypothetical protein
MKDKPKPGDLPPWAPIKPPIPPPSGPLTPAVKAPKIREVSDEEIRDYQKRLGVEPENQ